MIKKVLFINPGLSIKEANESSVYPPVGLAYLAAVLEEKKVECKILDLNLKNFDFLKVISEFNPDMVGLGLNIANYKEGCRLAKLIKEKGRPVVLGGPYASSFPEEMLKKSGADCVLVGEAEDTILDLIEGREFSEIKGICYFDKKFVNNGYRKPILDLDRIPFPAWHLLPSLKEYKGKIRRKPKGYVLTSRGCPYQCIYCNKNIFGSKFRKRSAENVFQEIKFLANRYGVKEIEILDDNFVMDYSRAEEILDKVIASDIEVLISFENGVRADGLNENLIRKMKKAGVYKVAMGVESGDQEIVNKIGKNLKLDKVKDAVRLFKKYNIQTSLFFMLGLPWDTKETMRKTIDFAKEVNPMFANFAITVPLKGTKLYEMIGKDVDIEKGFYTIGDANFEYGNLKSEDVKEALSDAYKEFFLRPQKSMEIVLNLRSFSELKWLFGISWPFLKHYMGVKE